VVKKTPLGPLSHDLQAFSNRLRAHSLQQQIATPLLPSISIPCGGTMEKLARDSAVMAAPKEGRPLLHHTRP